MTWYELLKTLHVLAIAGWFGSGLAIVVIGIRTLAAGKGPFSAFALQAGWWAGKAHPAAGIVLLLTGFAMVADADISMGEPWISIALVGLIAAMGVGGALIGRTSTKLTAGIQARGEIDDEGVADARRLLLYSRIELAILVLVVADMVAKPGA